MCNVYRLWSITMSIIKGFILCYKTGVEANRVFDDLVSLRNKSPIEYDLFQYLNEMDVPYPHVVIIAVREKDFKTLDIVLTDFDFKDVDIYALDNRLHEIKRMTFIKQDLSESFKKYIHRQNLVILK